jgi:hypothetical protein
VREIRQFVRSKFIVVLTNLYVFLISFFFLILLATIDIDGAKRNTVNFLLLLGQLMPLAIFLSVVIRTVWSTSVDRINEDLMFYTSIKPSAIVCGKLVSGVIINLILMSITMPFITLLYSIGGVDLLTVGMMFVELFVVMQVLNALAILVAATSKIHFSPIISLIVISIAFIALYVLEVMVIEEWINMEYSAMLIEFAGLLALEIAAFALITGVAIAKFSPQNSNRLVSMRIILTLLFILAVAYMLFEVYFPTLLNLNMWDSVNRVTAYLLILFLVLVVCERDEWSARIQRGLPKSLLLRVIIFPFCTGSACGLVWVLVLAGVLVLVNLVLFLPTPPPHNNIFYNCEWGNFTSLGSLMFFSFYCCVTAMLIRSWFLKKIDTSKTWAIAGILLLFVYIFSFLIYVLVTTSDYAKLYMYSEWYKRYSESRLASINPVSKIFYEITGYAYFGIILWGVILLPFLFFWYCQRLKNFSPHNISEPISYEEAANTTKNT